MKRLRYAALLTVLLSTTFNASAQAPETNVVAVKAMAMTLIDSSDAVGYIHAHRETSIRAEIDDRIAEVLVRDGAKVKKGDILFRFDDAVEKAQLKSTIYAHRAKLDLVRRMRVLIREKAVAKTKLATAELDALQAQVAVEKAQIGLRHTEVRAPSDGVLGALNVELGDYAAPGETLTTIYSMTPMQARFLVPQKLLARMRVGQEVSIWSSAAPGDRHSGKITFIDPALDVATKSLQVRAELDEPGKMRPGMFVSISIILKKIPNAVTIPNEALVPVVNGFSVFTVKDGKAKMIPVTTGLWSGDNVQVLGDIAEGDLVVTKGQIKLRNSAPVALVGQGGDK